MSALKEKKTWLSIASFACFLHCLALPLLAPFLPALAHESENMVLEFGILALSLLCGAWVLISGFKLHHKKKAFILYAMGFIFWILHALADLLHYHGSKPLLWIGALFLCAAYLLNRRLEAHRRCCGDV